jgi:hypothetical protein
MRLTLLSLLAMLAGCSALDKLALSQAHSSNTTKINLGREQISIDVVDRREMERYTCGAVPMTCSLWGSSWRCRCPR